MVGGQRGRCLYNGCWHRANTMNGGGFGTNVSRMGGVEEWVLIKLMEGQRFEC